jgi:methionyl aminopeptidase
MVRNQGKVKEGIKLEKGMCIAIEPMFAIGTGEIVKAKDESYITKDGSLSAHFEHTMTVTEDGVEVLTARETIKS